MDSRTVQAEIAAVSLQLKDFELLKQAAERDLLKDEVDQRAALVRKKCLERAWDRWRITEFGRAVLGSARATGVLAGNWPPQPTE
jgi:hypothetical protein